MRPTLSLHSSSSRRSLPPSPETARTYPELATIVSRSARRPISIRAAYFFLKRHRAMPVSLRALLHCRPDETECFPSLHICAKKKPRRVRCQNGSGHVKELDTANWTIVAHPCGNLASASAGLARYRLYRRSAVQHRLSELSGVDAAQNRAGGPAFRTCRSRALAARARKIGASPGAQCGSPHRNAAASCKACCRACCKTVTAAISCKNRKAAA